MKVLALAESSQDGEALAALRAAQQLLAAHGLTLEDVAAAYGLALTGRPRARHEIDASRGLVKAMQARLAATEYEIEALRKDLDYATRLAERWKTVAENGMRDTARHQAAADKWRALARDTADHLWDLGRQLQTIDEAPAGVPISDSPASGTVVRFSVKKR